MEVICAQQLCRSYGRRRGVIDVGLSVSRGEIFGFLGPNGAGKSTTIRLLMGFLRASSGTATIFGEDCWTRSHLIKRDVGYVAGDVRLYPWLTARRAFDIISQVRGEDIRERGSGLAERFQLEPTLPLRKMSRGNRQKLALVAALAPNPKLLILDEPTSGLDPLMQDTLADCLREMAVAGSTVFFSSHTLSEVESLCDRVAIVRDGRIVVDERIQKLQETAPRVVTVTFEEGTDLQSIPWPEFVTPKRRHRQEVVLQMDGPAARLTQFLAEQPVADISISPPSLEALFRGYYEDPEAE